MYYSIVNSLVKAYDSVMYYSIKLCYALGVTHIDFGTTL